MMLKLVLIISLLPIFSFAKMTGDNAYCPLQNGSGRYANTTTQVTDSVAMLSGVSTEGKKEKSKSQQSQDFIVK